MSADDSDIRGKTHVSLKDSVCCVSVPPALDEGLLPGQLQCLPITPRRPLKPCPSSSPLPWPFSSPRPAIPHPSAPGTLHRRAADRIVLLLPAGGALEQGKA
jgi:hypothetical protein